MAVPYTFGTATSSIPLSQLDSNFNTVITLGNTAIQLGNTVTTLNNMTLANVTISSGNVTITNVTITTANVTTANIGTAFVSGNVSFTSTGNRITGDFNNSTIANRLMFQGSVVNGGTVVTAIPNGTSASAQLVAANASDPTNAQIAQVFVSASEASFRSAAYGTGTGTYLPMTFYTSGAEKLRIAADTTGTYTFGGTAPRITGDFSNATASNRVIFQTSTASSNTRIGMMPNAASSGTAGPVLYSTNDPNNASVFDIRITDGVQAALISTFNGTGTNLPMTFSTGGSERMRLDTSGNVLVGTTSNTSTVGTAIRSAFDASSTVFIGKNNSPANANWMEFAGGGVTRAVLAWDTTGGGAWFGSTTTYPVSFYTNNTERMRIDSAGNVGIGTSSPTYRLSVKQSGNTSTASLGVTSINSANDTFIGMGYDSASDTNRIVSSYVSTGAFKPITFLTSDTERMRINSSGNVGIGTTGPVANTRLTLSDTNSSKLNITGGSNQNGMTFAVTGTSNEYYMAGGVNLLVGGDKGFLIYDATNARAKFFVEDTTGETRTLATTFLSYYTGGSERMRIDSSGNVLVTSAAGLGYGTGSGGTVTQATSKSTAVTLNKPTGQITMNAAALAAGASVFFDVNDSLVAATDNVLLTLSNFSALNYTIKCFVSTGKFTVILKNETAGSLSEAVVFNFGVLKGATA